MPPRSAASLLVRLDTQKRGSLQRQIYAGLQRAILGGVVGPGTRLPSSRALAEDLGVSRTTTLLALDQLASEGYLTSRPGSGLFVAQELPEDLPRVEISRQRGQPRPTPLSRRGEALAVPTPAARRVAVGPPRPFRIGVPAVDLFPVELWSQLARRRLRSVTAADLDYGEAAGLRALREAIADHVRVARGTECDADQVFVVAGAQRATEIACHLLLDPGDRAWMEEPGYPGTRKALLSAGARIVPVRVDAEGLDVAAGARLARDARVVCVAPSHQYPLGVPMSLPRRLALLKWARRARAWIVEDDYDSEFRHGARPLPCLQGLDADGRVIYVGSFAKTVFPALRLGFLIVPAGIAERVRSSRRGAELHPSSLEQAVLAEFIRAGHFERHLRRMRRVYRERLFALAHAAERYCGGALRLRPVHTGLHAVADLFGVDAGGVFEEAMSRGVEVMPLSAYYFGRGRPVNGLVLGFGAVRPDAMLRGMQVLAAAIDAVRRRS
jgi:GntR family transcriptional regulator/MocR family aminotransferase